MSTGLSTQIDIDVRGVAWIAGANTKVKEIQREIDEVDRLSSASPASAFRSRLRALRRVR